ncbi:MAG: SAM-dependent methyltransferase [Clostridia bacterium]|nr:SAM-dependent methyltransferase [Clostridia bacterium]
MSQKEWTVAEAVTSLCAGSLLKGVISNPKGETPWKKVNFRRLEDSYQIEKFTQKQAFHSHCDTAGLEKEIADLLAMGFRQVDAWSENTAFSLKISKKGKVTLLKKAQTTQTQRSHNREKQYLLKEDTNIPPLIDLGVFTKEGKVVQSMYGKFRQINRFTELIRDGLEELGQRKLKILDFGCGKSYLTFILYHYLTQVRGMETEICGLDLKEDVIAKCNQLAQKYGYEHLKFQTGDINGFESEEKPDMVITLHACDTATDYALHHAIRWGCKLIYSVPCCQHELNGQIQGGDLSLLTRYGLIQERFSALSTDAIRGALLEACGYQVQMLEFVDFSHSPKNLLIRAVKKSVPMEKRKKALRDAEKLMQAFGFQPTLYQLLKDENLLA